MCMHALNFLIEHGTGKSATAAKTLSRHIRRWNKTSEKKSF